MIIPIIFKENPWVGTENGGVVSAGWQHRTAPLAGELAQGAAKQNRWQGCSFVCYLQMFLRIRLPWNSLKEEFVPVTAELLEISRVISFLVNLAAKFSPSHDKNRINILDRELYERSP